jgi:type I restriction enzyme, S subunit
MNKPTTKTLVPKLRFPEFRDAGEWEEKRLTHVCDVNPTVKELPQKFVYIDLESVEAGVLLKKKIIELKGAPSRAQRLLKKGDLIFQMVRPYQKNNYLFRPDDDFSYVASTGYAQLRAHQSNMYLFQYLHIESFISKVLSKCTGSNYPAINSSDLSEIKVEIPKLHEQQKIADCLSSVDELITAHTQKHDALKAHKKGLMQQLFPVEGETVPQLRFPEFRDAEKWKEKKLGDVSKYTKGFAFKSQDYRAYGVRIVRVSDLGADYIKTNNDKTFISEDLTSSYDKYRLVVGNIIITTVGSKPELIDSAVGRGIYVSSNNEGLLNQNLLKLEVFDEVNSKFLFSYINTSKYIHFISSISRGNANQANITVKELLGYKIMVTSPKEQQKIADCLSSIDDLITAQAQKTDVLKAHKKGLIQQLFPAVDKVSG